MSPLTRGMLGVIIGAICGGISTVFIGFVLLDPRYALHISINAFFVSILSGVIVGALLGGFIGGIRAKK